MVNDASAALAKNTLAVAVINVDHRTVFFCQCCHLIQRSDVAVHGENAVGDDQFSLGALVGLENGLQFTHVVVRIDRSGGFGQTNTVND